MKRSVYIISMILIVLLALAGCSSPAPAQPEYPAETPAEAPAEPAAQEPAPITEVEERLSETFASIMQMDAYTMKYKTISNIDGKEIEGEITMAVEGDNYAMVFDSDIVQSTSVMKDGMLYLIMHEQKMVMAFPADTDQAAEAGSAEPVDINTEGMTYTGKGEAIFMGNTRPYEEYAVKDGTIRYYFDGRELDGIEMKFGGSSNILDIEELREGVDATLFDIPEGYQMFEP
jgi:hypothetical protein